MHGLAPQYLRDKFVHRNNISNYSLRDAENKLAIPLPRTNYMKNSFSYSGAVLWNSLPAEMRQADDLSTFRLDCKNYPNWKYNPGQNYVDTSSRKYFSHINRTPTPPKQC